MATLSRHRARIGQGNTARIRLTALQAVVALALLSACKGRLAGGPEGYYRSALEEYRKGAYQSALAKAKAGEAAMPAASHSEWHWRFRLLHAETLLSTGSAAQAVPLLRVDTASAGPAPPSLEARRLLNLGYARSLLGANEEGLAVLDQACLLAENTRDDEALLQAELRRGTVLGYLKRPAESERSYQRGLVLARGLREPYFEASALGSMGFLRLNAARYEEAIYWFEQALPLARRIKSAALEALLIDNLGWCYYRLGDLVKATQHFERALALFAAMGKQRDYQIALGNHGSAWFARGDYPRAIDAYEKALAIARQLKHQSSAADWLSNLATAHIELGSFDRAAALNEEAKSLRRDSGNRQADALLTVNEGLILEHRGDPGQAEARYRLAAGTAGSEPSIRFEARARLARLIARQGRTGDADREYRTLLVQLNEYRGTLARQDWKITWQSSLIRFYKDYVDFLWGQNRKGEALEVAESSRARVLAERLGNLRLHAASGPANLSATARRTGCTLLSYWLGSSRSYLWVITGQGTQSFELPPQSVIAADVDSYRRAIERLRDPLQSDLPSQERLSRTLLGPLPKPQGCFILSPDQELHGLNFETLLIDSGGRQQFWIQQAEVSIVPSLAIQTAAKANGDTGVLLLGDPAPADPIEFPPLANAGAELDAVASLMALRPVTLIRGEKATPASYRNAEPARFGLIHIAAHATANRESPLDSAVVLTRDGERYSLSAREISGIPIQARLVTVSACRSAGSRAFAGEGTVGLAWAFLHAGAHNVIAGLWAVDDVSTSKLMEQLYSSLAQGVAPAAALRSAKLSLVRSSTAMRKPYYWAPFQLYRLP